MDFLILKEGPPKNLNDIQFSAHQLEVEKDLKFLARDKGAAYGDIYVGLNSFVFFM